MCSVQFSSVQSLGCVQLFVTPWIVHILCICEVKVIQNVRLFSTSYIVHGILQARILEWVAFPFSRGSSQPRDWTQVSRIAGGFFTSWATKGAQEYWCGWPSPSPANLPDAGIRLGSPALQADSLPIELSGKPILIIIKKLCRLFFKLQLVF